MKKFRLSIVARLAFLVLVLALPLSVILAWNIQTRFNKDMATARQQVLNISTAAAARAEIILAQTHILLKEIAKRPRVQAMDRRSCDPFLAEMQATFPRYANLNVLNRKWEFVCSAAFRNREILLPTKYPEVYEEMIRRDDMVMSPPIRGQLTRIWVSFGAYPVKDKNRKLLGAVTAPIDLKLLGQAISDTRLPPGTTMRILDSYDRIVASFPDNSLLGKHDRRFSTGTDGGETVSGVTTGADGIERIYAHVPLQHSSWVVYTGLPIESALTEARRFRNQSVLFVLMVFSLAAILVIVMARQMVLPILELKKDTEILADGVHSHRSKVNSGDEIAQLAAAFNHMAQALEEDEKERDRSEQAIRNLNRVYTVQSQIDNLIVRASSRDELFNGACRVTADAAGFRMAMIVTIDPETGAVDSLVSAGADEYLLNAVKKLFSTEDGLRKSVIPRVINEKKAFVSNHTDSDARLIFGDQYAKASINSMVVLPLIVSDVVVGVMALYASDADFFHEDEVKLLTDLTGNIAFAMDHIEKQDRLNYLAYYDDLTGLANRSLLLERLSRYIRSAERGGHKLAFGLMDLERFQNINDSLGREAGDQLLRQVAGWLSETMQDPERAARLDADHFAIVLPEVKANGNLSKLCARQIEAFQEHQFTLRNSVFRFGAKMGIAVFPDDAGSADELISNAQAALKIAKSSGNNYMFYRAEMKENTATRLQLENQLRQAISSDEFVLHYQPKLNLASKSVAGAEALIRWQNPRTGLVPPGEFIPVLEETGMIHEVGRWAMRKAIEDILYWRETGMKPLPVAVNVSPLQLSDPGFYDELRHAIAADPFLASNLEIEITESLVMVDLESSISVLQQIRDLGISVAIDDFGTGFSSLSYLAKLPVNILKVDRSFILEMGSAEGLELVGTITRVAHALNLKVVAEGVETETQLKQLQVLNCEEVQGFLFSKPLPAEDYADRFLALTHVL